MPHTNHSTQNASASGSAANSNSATNLNSSNNGGGNSSGPNSAGGAGGSSSPSDDLGSTDEVKVFKDEGDEDEEVSSQNLQDEKESLIESEVSVCHDDLRQNCYTMPNRNTQLTHFNHSCLQEKSGKQLRQEQNSVFGKSILSLEIIIYCTSLKLHICRVHG